LGAALLVTHDYFNIPRWRSPAARDGQRGSYLGPSFSLEEVQAFLDRHLIPHRVITDRKARAEVVADALSQGKVVGYFNGRMEFGPRVLGARSMPPDARTADMQSKITPQIKFRESFRPFAPAVLHDRVAGYFELDRESPYMALVANIRPERRAALQ